LAVKLLGFEPQSDRWQTARRGDIVIVQSPRVHLMGVRQALGLVLANNIAVPQLDGLGFIETSTAIHVWHL
jgi:hypothetical protein